MRRVGCGAHSADGGGGCQRRTGGFPGGTALLRGQRRSERHSSAFAQAGASAPTSCRSDSVMFRLGAAIHRDAEIGGHVFPEVELANAWSDKELDRGSSDSRWRSLAAQAGRCSRWSSGRVQFLVDGVEQRFHGEGLGEVMTNPVGPQLGVALRLARLIGQTAHGDDANLREDVL